MDVSYINGVGTATYQWYENTVNNNSGGTLIPGATSSSYTPPVFNTIGYIITIVVIDDMVMVVMLLHLLYLRLMYHLIAPSDTILFTQTVCEQTHLQLLL